MSKKVVEDNNIITTEVCFLNRIIIASVLQHRLTRYFVEV